MTRRALVSFVDVLFLILLVFVLLPHRPADTESLAPPGSVIVEIRWPDEWATDVDLWVQAPGDRPVGYSAKNGVIFDLLRDDLGLVNDALNLNYENAFTRGAPDGDYTVNLHFYANVEGKTPVPVMVQVSLRHPSGALTRIFEGKAELHRPGEEITVVRFSLAGLDLVPGSLNDLYKPLRESQ